MKPWLFIAAINGFLAVAAGAFATHGLQSSLDPHALDIFQTAARYHMYHALALGLVAVVMRDSTGICPKIAAWLFLAGIILFCGSLYLFALTANHIAVYVTPIGGTAFMAGWIALAIAALTFKRNPLN